MECLIHVAGVDQGVEQQADVLQPHLERLGRHLSQDYGGEMQHLWIQIQICPGDADRGPPLPFRLQRRVSGRQSARRLGLPAGPDTHQVGSFAVRPDPVAFAATELDELPAYVIRVLHQAAVVLEEKSAQLGGFDAPRFRKDILRYLEQMAG